MKKITIIISLIAILCSCNPQQLSYHYNTQMVDEAYVKIDKQCDLLEDLEVRRLVKKLDADTVICRHEYSKHYWRGGHYITKHNQISYILVDCDDLNKITRRGKGIVKDKYRNKLIYHLK